MNTVLALAQQQQLEQQPHSFPVGVKITSPLRGQQLPAGNNLTVWGMSKINTTASNCHVFVILNGIRPYQEVLPIGQNLSSNAYSDWSYTLNPVSYPASIKEGNNKITAKMHCEGSPVSITKFYSINVTGVNQTLPKLVTAYSNASAAPSVLPVSSNISLANQSSSDPTSNTNPTGTSVHHHHESSVHQTNDNKKGTVDSNHHKKQSSPSSHHHKDHQGKGSDIASKIVTHVKRLLGI